MIGGAGWPIRAGRFGGTIGEVLGSDPEFSDMSACFQHRGEYLYLYIRTKSGDVDAEKISTRHWHSSKYRQDNKQKNESYR
jgi:hypothetical protein